MKLNFRLRIEILEIPALLVAAWMIVISGCGGGGTSVTLDIILEPEISGDVSAEVVAPDVPGQDVTGCLTDAECKYLEADAGPCQAAVCDDGACLLGPMTDGIMCDDGDLCTGGDLCEDGQCVPGEPVVCEDEEPCTEDSCDPATGECVFAPAVGESCDDGDPCTDGDICLDDGTCGGTAVECVDENPCTEDGCDPAFGCVFTAVDDGTGCDDGDACTGIDLCIDGDCVGGPAPECDDGNPCTADGCDPEIGCVNDPLSDIPCDDGNSCTVEDTCQEGACEPGVNQCICEEDDDCAVFEDGDLCTGSLICEEGVCEIDPETVVVCDGSDDTDCLYTVCMPETGECVQVQAYDGAACDDGDLCTDGDACLGGVCGSGGLSSCKDGNPCTEDSCDPLVGCINTPLTGTSCDDGNPCTSGDECVEGVCESGMNTCFCAADGDCAAFEDGDLCNGTLICVESQCLLDEDSVVECPPPAGPCVSVACDPDTGDCPETPVEDGLPCDDEDACTEGDACIAGVCEGGAPLYCYDEDLCTGDECDPLTGCVFPPLSDTPCEDGDPCTEGDLCQEGTCVSGENTCECEVDEDCDELNDGNPCTGVYVCVEFACQIDPDSVVVCDDGMDSDCIKNQCSPDSGECVLTAQPEETPCDDGDVCTEFDSCAAGLCIGAGVVCDDGNPCTDDLCDSAAGGCVATDNNDVCDDEDPCTEDDLCLEGVCAGSPILCDDGNPCTFDLCEDGDCIYNDIDGSCDDGDVCTQTDLCEAGVCVGTDPQDCDDGNPCTVNTCDPADGCQTKDADEPCDDGDVCTDGDWCVDGTCVPGASLDCDDGNPCTADSCAAFEGCLNEPLDGVDCDTGDLCFIDGLCEAGTCVGQPLDCDDGDPCTADLCASDSGCYTEPASGEVCEDGNACTTGDLCQNGACLGGPPLDCDDGLVCTDDYCDTADGCVNDPVPLDGVSCDDGDACTLNDVCADGICAGPEALDCDDDNVCTADSCDPELGCVYDAAPGTCDDGDPCTVDDACVDGVCLGTPMDCDDGDPCTQDLCDSEQGCFNPPVADEDEISCDDEDLCTLTDTCVGGECVGGDPLDCDDGNVCTDDGCDPGDGECVYTNNDADCDDDDLCTTVDGCVDGDCVGLEEMECDDGNVCTDDLCVEILGGCAYVPNTAPCDDGNPCTDGDVCSNTVCVPGENVCECEEDADCADQEDGDLCNGTLICPDFECVVDPATVVACDDGGDTDCLKNTCVPGTGECVMTPEPPGTDCDDGSLCTTGDQCLDGACVGDAVTCEQDDNPCTLDVCEPADGCVTTFVSGDCDDGDPCTVDDACAAGECAGQPYDCDDDNVCTDDFCFDLGGAPQCFYQNVNGIDCDDGSVCTVDDVCEGGDCVGDAITCDDDNVCTDDSCDPVAGCQYTPNTSLCDDGDLCTLGDVCSGGACEGSQKDCDDDNVCTDDSCNSDTGDCEYVDNSDPCDDGEVCTVDDTCVDGVCVGEEMVCDDDNECTADSCEPGVGCVYEPTPGVPCDDDDVCTDADLCTEDGECLGDDIPGCCHEDADCESEYPCNEGACVDNWCVYSAIDCDDGNDCTADVCAGGDCDNVPFGEDGAEIYAEGFDDDDPHGWTTWIGDDATTDEVYWSVDDERSFTAPNSLYGGNPEEYSYDFGVVDAWAASPWIQLPADVPMSLMLRYWADFNEDSYTYDWVDVYLQSQGEDPVNVGARIHASTGGAWVSWSVSGSEFNPFSGEEVRVLLRFGTMDAILNAGEGIYVDDVTIVAGEKEGCCEFDSDCFTPDLCTEDVCGEDWQCTSDDVAGSYLWEVFPDMGMPAGWITTTTNPDLYWSVRTFRSVSTQYSLYGGNPETQTYDHGAGSFAVVTPAFNLKYAVTPVARFNLFADFEDQGCAADVLRVYALVWSGGLPLQVQIHVDCDGTGGAFVPVELDLSDFVDAVVQLRFTVSVDAAQNDGEGIYLDDLRVDEDGVEEPGCCDGSTECDDADECTTDICAGEPGAGVCVHPPLPLFEDYFDDGDSYGWTITGGGGSNVTWFVSDLDAFSEPFSLQASDKEGGVMGSGWTTAFSPAFPTSPAGGGPLVLEYYRTLYTLAVWWTNLQVQWWYRTSDGGYWNVGGTLETVNAAEPWTKKIFSISPPWNAVEVRIGYRFNYTCWDPGGYCYYRANIDDIRLGWDGCM